jgi:hypothetical protein
MRPVAGTEADKLMTAKYYPGLLRVIIQAIRDAETSKATLVAVELCLMRRSTDGTLSFQRSGWHQFLLPYKLQTRT